MHNSGQTLAAPLLALCSRTGRGLLVARSRMRLPLLVVCKLSAHNLLATHAMAVSVPDRSELGAAADPADVPDLIACLLAAQQRRVDKFREFRRCARTSMRHVNLPMP